MSRWYHLGTEAGAVGFISTLLCLGRILPVPGGLAISALASRSTSPPSFLPILLTAYGSPSSAQSTGPARLNSMRSSSSSGMASSEATEIISLRAARLSPSRFLIQVTYSCKYAAPRTLTGAVQLCNRTKKLGSTSIFPTLCRFYQVSRCCLLDTVLDGVERPIGWDWQSKDIWDGMALASRFAMFSIRRLARRCLRIAPSGSNY